MELPLQNNRNHSDKRIDVCCETVASEDSDNDPEKIMPEEVANEGIDMEVEYITSQ